MPRTEWGSLLPAKVADWINFDRENPNWHYVGKDASLLEPASMASLQAEGVAYLWNLLSTHGVALLADEVGMGKTYQALGVAALLWKMKPDAKILVMAPNRDICAHWERELNAFVQFHYRHADHCVKNSVDKGLVPVVKRCARLEELATAVEDNAAHLYLTTIYSLSGLVPQSEKESDILAKARANARKIRSRIQEALDGHGFDLVIIDEAHYFRNKDGDSQRVNAAEEFFGKDESRLADKALLLTATPSHTRVQDISNILSYFTASAFLKDKPAEILMRTYALRRFRRMKGLDRTHTKRDYRKEIDIPCDFNERPESEMFFALYQKKLVTELGFTRNNKSLLYGFLEGFESPGRSALQSNEEDDIAVETEETREDNKVDFSKAKDTQLLARLSDQYFSKFSRSPDHPKYSQLVDMCVPDDLFTAPRVLHDDKHLIFVRRIPSVRELTQRINEAYDEILACKIYRAWGFNDEDAAVMKWRETSWSRDGLGELILKADSVTSGADDELEDDDLDADEDNETKLGSNIAGLFVVKKGQSGQTDCSNVSLRFRKRESAFALFLEPASDYLEAGYDVYYEDIKNKNKRAEYVTAAHDVRLRKHGEFTRKLETENLKYTQESYKQTMHSVWTLVFPLLSSEQQTKLKEWSEQRPDISENFGNYIKAGFLFASPVMVELYAWFTAFNRRSTVTHVQEKYLNFIEFVKPKIPASLLLAYFSSALDTFDTLCEKIIDHNIGEWEKEWRSLRSLQNPAWYASGETANRQRLIMGFNSPFYPNVLVATSVFKEGVNLHLQCRQVHHYGIADSPGDNEQRVGRIDRLFGKVNELLRTDAGTTLDIHYPFLNSSVDEDQVASFVARKYQVEDKLDNCTQSASSKVVELTRENWKMFLRQPMNGTGADVGIIDPYEALFDGDLPKGEYVPFKNNDDLHVVEHIAALLAEILDPASDKLFRVDKNEHNPNAIFMIDPAVKHKNESRRQPVLIEQHFSAEFSALIKGTVYYVSFTSPLARKEELEACPDYENRVATLAAELMKQCPLVRVAIDNKAQNSYFYLHARVDLPVFIGAGCLEMLSKDELNLTFQQLKSFSDQFELGLFAGTQDLDISQLRLRDYVNDTIPLEGHRANHTAVGEDDGQWEPLSSEYGDSEHLFHELPISDFNKHYIDADRILQKHSQLMKVLIVNGQHPFVNFWSTDDEQIKASIAYPSGDIQMEERQLLERWFDYLLRYKS